MNVRRCRDSTESEIIDLQLQQVISPNTHPLAIKH